MPIRAASSATVTVSGTGPAKTPCTAGSFATTGGRKVPLLAAGIESADAFVASTDGDNTNLVIAQIAQRRFEVDRVVVRVLDPARARWYAEQGLQTVCPTQTAIELLEAAVRGQIRFEGVSG